MCFYVDGVGPFTIKAIAWDLAERKDAGEDASGVQAGIGVDTKGVWLGDGLRSCKCMPGWTGDACDTKRCPKDCDKHGARAASTHALHFSLSLLSRTTIS